MHFLENSKKMSCLATVAGTLILILTFYLVQVNRCVFCDVGIANLRRLIWKA